MRAILIILLLTLIIILIPIGLALMPKTTQPKDEVFHVYYEYKVITNSKGHTDTIPIDTTYIPYKVILDYPE